MAKALTQSTQAQPSMLTASTTVFSAPVHTEVQGCACVMQPELISSVFAVKGISGVACLQRYCLVTPKCCANPLTTIPV